VPALPEDQQGLLMGPEQYMQPSQRRIFKAIVGAHKNACDGHRDKWTYDETYARSVAKRATGTLTSQWSVLAAPSPSDQAAGGAPPLRPHVAASPWGVRRAGGRRCQTAWREPRRRSPLKFLQNRIGCLAGEARRAGNTERELALVEVLRLIGAERSAR